jgi:hypothetical protein
VNAKFDGNIGRGLLANREMAPRLGHTRQPLGGLFQIMIVFARVGECELPALGGVVLATLLLFGSNAVDAVAGEIPFQELDADRCFMFSAQVPYKREGNDIQELPFQLVINNEHGYENLFDPKIMRQSCAGVDRAEAIPKVDFSRQTVLGLWASGSCAARDFRKKVWRDDAQKRLIYSVTVIESPVSCSGPGLRMSELDRDS